MLYNMKSKVEIKHNAISLRKNGLSYKEIMSRVQVSKSTLSNWCSGLELTSKERENLEGRILVGRDISRAKAKLSHNNKRIERENRVYEEAFKEFNIFKSDDFFFVGIVMYWAEGSKKSKSFQFINSDPEMISLMIKWIEKFLKIPRNTLKYRLFIHEPYMNENCEEFWSSTINVSKSQFQKTIYKPTRHLLKKNPVYIAAEILGIEMTVSQGRCLAKAINRVL